LGAGYPAVRLFSLGLQAQLYNRRPKEIFHSQMKSVFLKNSSEREARFNQCLCGFPAGVKNKPKRLKIRTSTPQDFYNFSIF
jgi:hypothetical protein